MTAPTLLIAGGHDEVVLDLNRRAQKELRCENDLAVVPGASHLFEEPGTLDAAGLARDWFITHLTDSPHGAGPSEVAGYLFLEGRELLAEPDRNQFGIAQRPCRRRKPAQGGTAPLLRGGQRLKAAEPPAFAHDRDQQGLMAWQRARCRRCRPGRWSGRGSPRRTRRTPPARRRTPR